jgi:hypothetical protein
MTAEDQNMANAAVRDELAAPIAAVWACFANFGDLSAWAPGPPRVTLEGQGIGSIRTVWADGKPNVRERLETYDTARRTFSYRIVESPFPFTAYVAMVRLGDLGGGRTSIEWSSTFEPRGLPAEQTTAVIEGTYRMFIARLKETLAG